MKRILLSILIVMVNMAVFAAKGYVFTQKYTGASNANVTVSWYVTDDKCKMKMLFGNSDINSVSWFIPDFTGNLLLSYNEGAVPNGVSKAFYKLPIDNVRVQGNNEFSRISIEKTTENKEIGGLVCDKYVVKTNKTETEVWVTRKFSPAFYRYYPFYKDNSALAGLYEGKVAGFPLESVTKDLTGKVVAAYHFVSAVEIELNDADFQVPAEYKSPEEIRNGSK
jgi:hypothetical protein